MSWRRALRLAGAAPVAAVAVVASLVPAAAPAAAQDAPVAAAVDVAVVYQSPAVDEQGDFTFVADVAGAPAGSDLAVDIYDRIDDAQDLVAASSGTPDDTPATFEVPAPLTAAGDGARLRGAFTINTYRPDEARPPGTWAFELDEGGVYPVRVRVRDADGDVLTSLLTYLVLAEPGDAARPPARVALLTRVHSDPPPAADERAATDQADADLVQDLDPVLAALGEHPELPITFAVTPDTLARLDGDPTAAGTLTALRTEVGAEGRELLDSPYVDIDASALVAGDLESELDRQASLGTATLTQLLAVPTAGTWFLDRDLDAEAVAALAARDRTRLVLPASAVTGVAPRAPVTLPGGDGAVDALTIDRALAIGSGGDTDPALLAHQFVARISALATLSPTPVGVVVEVDPGALDLPQLDAVLAALAETNPYVTVATASDLFDQVPSRATPADLAPPGPTDLTGFPTKARQTHALLASYASMLDDRPDLLEGFQRPLAISAAADLDPADRRADLQAVEDDLRARFAAVSAPERDKITLGAREAKVPLAIDLDPTVVDYPVRVLVEVEASDRLSFNEERRRVTLQDERTVINIGVRVRATGDTPMLVTVRTPDGRVVLSESRYTVRSTAVSGVGVFLTVGAAAFLALWWGRNWHRNRRPDDPADPDPADVTDPAGTGSNAS